MGFRAVRQKGSHIILKGTYNGINRTVVVPKHKEIAIGTVKAIISQAGIPDEKFVQLIEN